MRPAKKTGNDRPPEEKKGVQEDGESPSFWGELLSPQDRENGSLSAPEELRIFRKYGRQVCASSIMRGAVDNTWSGTGLTYVVLPRKRRWATERDGGADDPRHYTTLYMA